MIKELISAGYFFKAGKYFIKKNWVEAEKNLLSCLEYYKDQYHPNMQMAYISEMIKGDEVAARRYLASAENYKKKGQNAYILSKAYLELKAENFSEFLRLYGIVKKAEYIEADLVRLGDDFLSLYEKTRDPKFLFAEGLVKCIWLPQDNGKEKLNNFLTLTENQTKYEVLRKEAMTWTGKMRT